MVDKQTFRDVLLVLVAQGKTNYELISSLLAETAALRDTVRGLGPTFTDVLAQKREDAARANAPLEQAILKLYDDLMRRLQSGEV
jgi:hypothetical protein